MSGYMGNPDCHFGDHTWRGTSQCVYCGERLRCTCGVYVREDNLEDHLKKCRFLGEPFQDQGTS